MKLFFTSFVFIFSLNAYCQTMNYDGNNDGCVNVLDMLNILIEFGQCEDVDFASCGDPFNHHNFEYSTVQIGDQCWFTENLNYLPQVNMSDDSSIESPKFYVYAYNGESVEEAMDTYSYITHGVLYNFPAILYSDICPSGWHVSSDEDWNYIISLYGGEWVAGEYLRAETWGNGNNESGLTLTPSGLRHFNGNFAMAGTGGYWWTSTISSGNEAWDRYTTNVNPNWMDRSSIPFDSGMSVRCVLDQ